MATKIVKKQRKIEAEDRQLAWNARSPQQKLDDLATRPGQSIKESARILAQMKKEKEKK